MTLPNVPLDQNMTPEVRRYLEAVKREIEAALEEIDGITIPTKASEAEAETGTDDAKFLTPLSGVAAVKAHSPFVAFAYFEDQKAANTAGGAASGGSTWDTRDLNTEVYNEISGVSIATNQVTLPAGTYLLEARAPAFRCNGHKARLFNVTDTATIAVGTTEHAPNNTGGTNPSGTTVSTVVTVLTVASSTAIRLEHQVDSASNDNDFGIPADMGVVEVYSTLKIWKLD